MRHSTRLLTIMLLSLGCTTALAKRAPSLQLKDLNGQMHTLSDLHGKLVVLSFWATWCGPCKEELPRLSKLSDKYQGKSVTFIAVSIDDAKDIRKIQPFLSEQHITLPVWVGGDTDLLARFGLGDIVPGTVVVDEQGEIVGRIMGEARDEDVSSRVDWVLDGKQGTPPEATVKRY